MTSVVLKDEKQYTAFDLAVLEGMDLTALEAMGKCEGRLRIFDDFALEEETLETKVFSVPALLLVLVLVCLMKIC